MVAQESRQPLDPAAARIEVLLGERVLQHSKPTRQFRRSRVPVFRDPPFDHHVGHDRQARRSSSHRTAAAKNIENLLLKQRRTEWIDKQFRERRLIAATEPPPLGAG